MTADATRPRETWLSPLIVLPNIGLAALNGAVAATARVAVAASQAAARAGVPLAGIAAESSSRVAARATTALKASTDLLADGVGAALGRPTSAPARALLSRTLIEETLKALAWPIIVAMDGASAALTLPLSKDVAGGLTGQVSRALATVSLPGVIPGDHGIVAAARTRMGFVVMATSDANAAFRTFHGIAGGVMALGVGDSAWLARGLNDLRLCAEYVCETEAKGGLGAGSTLPISPALVKISTDVIEHFPTAFVHALEHDGPGRASREYLANPAAVNRMIPLYLAFTTRMLYDVAMFFGKGVIDAPDAQKTALCELAIMESGLTPAAKDAALVEVRRTASNAIIGFEHHVSLVVPCDGTATDKAYRRTASGEVVDTETVVPSNFDKAAIAFAQTVSAEAYSLRAFLWLYRDERRAWTANLQETHRKFGPETAERLAARPVYPLVPAEVAELTRGGPRPDPEIEEILDGLLRERGLEAIADAVKARRRASSPAERHRSVRLVTKTARRSPSRP